MEFDANPTIQEILDELNKTVEGKTQLELAALRAVVAKQQAFIAVQSNEAEITAEDVSKVDDTSK
jgi:predicted ATP-dependent protease